MEKLAFYFVQFRERLILLQFQPIVAEMVVEFALRPKLYQKSQYVLPLDKQPLSANYRVSRIGMFR